MCSKGLKRFEIGSKTHKTVWAVPLMHTQPAGCFCSQLEDGFSSAAAHTWLPCVWWCATLHTGLHAPTTPTAWSRTFPKTEYTFGFVPVTVRVCFSRRRVVRLSDVGCVWQACWWWMAPTMPPQTRQERKRQSPASCDLKGGLFESS